MRESIHAKARRYLGEGRLVVREAVERHEDGYVVTNAGRSLSAAVTKGGEALA